MILLAEGKAVCAACGFKLKKKPKIKISEKMNERENVAVIKKEDNIHPVVEIKCAKCKNDKSYFWTQQTRAADESETKFYKCTKCGHSWRVYR